MTSPVGCNLLWLRPGIVGGTESYATRMLRAVAEHHPDIGVEVFAMGNAAATHAATLERHRLHVAPVADAHAARRAGIERTWLRKAASATDLRLLHHLGGTVPVVGQSGTVVTIHDLQPLEDPGNFSRVKRAWLARALPAAVGSADLICTPSDWVAASIRRRFGDTAPPIHTVSAPASAPLVPAAAPTPELQRLLSDGPVMLYPAMTLAHKNHRMLFRAFSVAARQRPDLQLVCVGAIGRDHDDLVHAAAALSERIHLLGHVSTADLAALMASAEALVFPSRYEGFGLPVLEAQQVGLPVVASNAAALPEVAGRGALLLDPDDVDAWIDVMSGPLPSDTRIELIRAGAENAERYTTQTMADAQVAAWAAIA